MPKEQVEGRFEEVKGKVKEVAGKVVGNKELVPEATVEHATVKGLIAQVEGMEPDGEDFDAKIKVLSECVKHHVKEEQNQMFPRAKESKLDMLELGAQIASRKQELIAERSRRA